MNASGVCSVLSTSLEIFKIPPFLRVSLPTIAEATCEFARSHFAMRNSGLCPEKMFALTVLNSRTSTALPERMPLMLLFFESVQHEAHRQAQFFEGRAFPEILVVDDRLPVHYRANTSAKAESTTYGATEDLLIKSFARKLFPGHL
jgi:hypothetical protein